MTEHETQGHVSVLLHEAIDGLGLKAGDIFLDATVGSGGHSAEVCKRFKGVVRIVGLDADAERVEQAKKVLFENECPAEIVNENFRRLADVLKKLRIPKVQAILFDLGLNSEQLEKSGRGFSFKFDEPLLMTFDSTQDLTARVIVNTYRESELADIFFNFGEERQARNIARALVLERKVKPIETTFQFIEAIRKGYRGKYPTSIHFATKTFQALRIAVNDELGALTEALTKGFASLSEHGRMAVISFHSLEDRIVKHFFRAKADEKVARVITKKPIVPGDKESEENPRSRSAKLRILEKI